MNMEHGTDPEFTSNKHEVDLSAFKLGGTVNFVTVSGVLYCFDVSHVALSRAPELTCVAASLVVEDDGKIQTKERVWLNGSCIQSQTGHLVRVGFNVAVGRCVRYQFPGDGRIVTEVTDVVQALVAVDVHT